VSLDGKNTACPWKTAKASDEPAHLQIHTDEMRGPRCSAGGASIRLSAPSSEILLSVLVGSSPRFGGQVPPHIYSIPLGDHDGFFGLPHLVPREAGSSYVPTVFVRMYATVGPPHSKPASGRHPGVSCFTSRGPPSGKLVLVRQLRGPHLSTGNGRGRDTGCPGPPHGSASPRFSAYGSYLG